MKDNGPKNWTAALGRHASMAQKRRFEQQQNEIKKAREAKAKDLDAQSEGGDDAGSSDKA